MADNVAKTEGGSYTSATKTPIGPALPAVSALGGQCRAAAESSPVGYADMHKLLLKC